MKIMKKPFRGKRAFSPVIAALILMLLAVAAGVVVYTYTMGWIGGATTSPGGTQGKLLFDSIYGDTTNSKIKIYVRNVGGKDLTTSFTSVKITVQSVKYLEVNKPMTLGYFYEVKVTCKDGTTVSQSVEAK